jgi:hypothetical protein
MEVAASARDTRPAADDRTGLRWSIASLALALLASLALVFIPLVTPGIDLPEKSGPATPTLATARETVIDSAGVAGVLLLLWPVAVTALPFRMRQRAGVRGFRALATILLLPLLPVGAFAVGGFYVPSVFAMAVASIRRRPTDP